MKKLTSELLDSIHELTPLNPFLFDNNGIINLIEPISLELSRLIEMDKWDYLYDYFLKNSKAELEMNISQFQHEQKWVLLMGQAVEYENKSLILCFCYDVSETKQKYFELEGEKRLRSLMLELTQSIFIANTISEIFDLSLVNSIKAIEKSQFGSIMLKNDDIFRIVSYIGYSEEILEFELPSDDSFLSRNTEKKMDRFVSVNTKQLGEQKNYNIVDNKTIIIKSTLTGPIYVEGHLYGMINIDSLEDNAFDNRDVQMMEFIRNNIEVAITNHKLYQEKLVLSRYDNLTSLYNRHYFEEQFELNQKRAHRYNETFYIVLFDINRFKSINDRYGHFIGDKVLKYISNELLKNQRESDILARFGGDEFIGAVFNSDLAELSQKYINLNEKLMHNELIVDEVKISCSFSFGIAQYPHDGETLDDLVKVADFEMYKNKRLSRD